MELSNVQRKTYGARNGLSLTRAHPAPASSSMASDSTFRDGKDNLRSLPSICSTPAVRRSISRAGISPGSDDEAEFGLIAPVAGIKRLPAYAAPPLQQPPKIGGAGVHSLPKPSERARSVRQRLEATARPAVPAAKAAAPSSGSSSRLSLKVAPVVRPAAVAVPIVGGRSGPLPPAKPTRQQLIDTRPRGLLAAVRNREVSGALLAHHPLGSAPNRHPATHHARLAAVAGAQRLFRRAPARLTVPMPSLGAQAPLLRQCVVLGFSRCGGFLYSYLFDSALRFELQAWAFAPQHGPTPAAAIDAAGRGLRHAVGLRAGVPPAHLRLHAAVPLFPSADWASVSAMGSLVEGESVRVTLWEPRDSGCIVVTGFLHEKAVGGARGGGLGPLPASRVPLPCHVTIVPSPCRTPGARSFSDLPLHPSAVATAVPAPAQAASAVTDPAAEDNDEEAEAMDRLESHGLGGNNGTGGMPPPRSSLNAAHFSYTVQAPYPRPVVLGLERIDRDEDVDGPGGDSGSRAYRLVLNSGDAVRAVSFRVRPAAVLPSPAPLGSVGRAQRSPQGGELPWWTDASPAGRALTQVTLADVSAADAYVRVAELKDRLHQAAEALVASGATVLDDDDSGSAVDANAQSVWGARAAGTRPVSHMRRTAANAHGIEVGLMPAMLALDQPRSSCDSGVEPALDPRCVCGSVVITGLGVMDVERLLAATVRGRAVNYDARLVGLVSSGEALARGWAPATLRQPVSRAQDGDSESDNDDQPTIADLGPASRVFGSSFALGVDARYALVTVVVDHRLEPLPTAPSAPAAPTQLPSRAPSGGAAASPHKGITVADSDADTERDEPAGSDDSSDLPGTQTSGSVDVALLAAEDEAGATLARAQAAERAAAAATAAASLAAAAVQQVDSMASIAGVKRAYRYGTGSTGTSKLALQVDGVTSLLNTSGGSSTSNGSGVHSASSRSTSPTVPSSASEVLESNSSSDSACGGGGWDDVLTDGSAQTSPNTTLAASPQLGPAAVSAAEASVRTGPCGCECHAAACGRDELDFEDDSEGEQAEKARQVAKPACACVGSNCGLVAQQAMPVTSALAAVASAAAAAAVPSPPAKFLVANVAPPVRSQLLALLDLHTGGVRVLRLAKLPPSQQPAFDAGGGGAAAVRSLPALTSSMVNQLRSSLVPPTALPTGLSRELTNDPLLNGASLTALYHPVLPLVVL